MDIKRFRERCCSFFIKLVSVILVGAASIANAVELDRNILNNGALDWENIFDVNPVTGVATPKNPLPVPYGKAVFIRDFVPGANGPDISTFATGSKDTLPITPGWECTRSNNVNDKTDIVNAYATVANEGGDTVVYFGLERYSNEGEGNIGFWFLQDADVACVLPPSGNPKTNSFVGNHINGDVLIVSEFTGGGKVATIEAYEWMDGALVPRESGGDCIDDGVGNLCAVVNDQLLDGWGAGFDVPWLTETKQPGGTPSNDLDVSEFFEGRINLSVVLETIACFSKYMGVTRSSTSLTATLFDYALDDFPLCSIDVIKQCRAIHPDDDPQDPELVTYPKINGTGDGVLSLFDVTVTNDGISNVYDVTIEEDTGVVAFDTGESCKVIAIDDVGVTETDISDGSPYDVAASLNTSVKATLLCERIIGDSTGNDNPFRNAVQARAKSSSSLVAPDLNEDYTMLDADLCPKFSPDPDIFVTKTCPDVKLVQDTNDGTVEIELGVRMTVKNTGEELLTGVSVSNTGNIDAFGGIIPVQHVNMDGTPAGAFDGELSVGETAYFASTYRPNDTDGDIGDPLNAIFSDTVVGAGVGKISGTSKQDSATANCELCPVD